MELAPGPSLYKTSSQALVGKGNHHKLSKRDGLGRESTPWRGWCAYDGLEWYATWSLLIIPRYQLAKSGSNWLQQEKPLGLASVLQVTVLARKMGLVRRGRAKKRSVGYNG